LIGSLKKDVKRLLLDKTSEVGIVLPEERLELRRLRDRLGCHFLEDLILEVFGRLEAVLLYEKF
jgi:hypothetical protein